MYNRPYSDKLAAAAGQRKDEKEYWLNKLSGDLVKSYFPVDFHKGGWSGDDVKSIPLKFPGELFHRLNKITGNNEIRLNIVLVTAVFVLLEKYTGHEDIIIGTPIYKQDADVDFINTVLTVKNRVPPDATFKEMILETGRVILEGGKNQNYPIERLLYELNMSSSPDEVFPLFDVAVLLENIHDRRYIRHINMNVVFSFLKSEDGIAGTVEYNSAVYSERTVERIGAHFFNLLGRAAFHADTPVVEIDILSEAERKEILVDFNDSSADYPKDKTVVQLFREQVQKAPDNVALVFEDMRLTYKKLDEMSNQLGRLLRRKGVGEGVPVGIMVERSLEMVVGIMGVLKAGGAYVPVSPDAPQNRLRYVFDNADIKIVLTQEKYAADYEGLYDLIALDCAGSYSGSVDAPGNINTPGDPAYVIYTSGSTGKPKGVMIRHRSVVNIVKWFARKYDLKIGFNLLQMFEYTFDASVNQIFGSMLHGVTLHIISKENFFDIEFLRDYITDNFINLINFVQSVIKELLCGREKLESLEHVISGAEKLKSSVKNEILDHGYSLYNQYGPTEVTVDATAEKCSRESDGTVGIPVDNAQCYIVNKFGRLNPVGVAGELWVSGDGLARGYINNVELTALKFIPNPFNPGTRVYKTGDLTRWLPAGNVEFLGRIDNQVKIRGFRIEPVEIANQLVKIGGIKEAVVIDRDDSSGDTYLCAYLVGTQDIDIIEIKGILAENLPDYMVPAAYVWIDQLPLSGHGKLIKSALPAPDITAGASEAYAAPGNPLEEKLVDIWAEVLNVDRQIVGVNSDFFELGGHSLRAVIMVSKIHKELDVRMPLTEVFRTPTVKGLAEYVKKATKDIYLSVEPVEKKEYYPLSSAQKRIYILNQMNPQSTAYNMYRIIPLGVSVEKQKVENVFRELINRHESLRTSFHMAGKTPVQAVRDNVEFRVEYYDLAGKTLDREVQDFVRPFDLSTAPILRGRVVKNGEDRHYLLVDMHHIISDGTSRVVLDRDILALYRGETLPPLKIQYKDFSQWQNNERESERLKRQEEYWLKAFADEVPVLDLPVDYPRPQMQSFEGAVLSPFALGKEKTAVLREYIADRGCTVFMMMLGILNILLAKLGGQEDIVVGTPVAGRPHAELQDIIGMFVNTLALRNYPSFDMTFNDFIAGVKERTLQAFENQEYQFEDLVDTVSVRRDTSRNPLFDTAFVLQNTKGPGEEIPELKLMPGEEKTGEGKTGVSKFDLTLIGGETEDDLFLSFEYCTKLFKEETVRRFGDYFKRIAFVVLENPSARLSEIDILHEEEKDRLLFDLNRTDAAYPEDKTVHRLFEEQVERVGDHIAVVGTGSVSYRELNRESEHLAQLLRARGVTPGTIVGLIMGRSVEMIVGILGILKAGGAYLPIDHDYPGERKRYMLEDSSAEMLITSRIFSEEDETAGEWEGKTYCIEELLRSSRPLTPVPSNPQRSSHLAYVIYTSGSTGKPKGVMVEHRSVVNLIHSQDKYFNIDRFDRILQFSSICFDASVEQIFIAFSSGAALVLVDKNTLLDTGKFEEYVTGRQVTHIHAVPSFLNNIQLKDTLQLKRMIAGGDVCPVSLSKKWDKTCDFYNEYGPTETTVTSIEIMIKDTDTSLSRLPVGKPIGNTAVYILDRWVKPVPFGAIGELHIGGPGVARGYLNRPGLTAEKFVENPFIPGQRMYKTGDLARWLPDGNIECLGRMDHQVKIRGFRVELGEIENRLLKIGGVKEAVVSARTDEKGNKYLCAYFVSDNEYGISELREHLSKELPEYMLPSYFVPMENIPLTANGKIDRKALPEPDTSRTKSAGTYVAPEEELEIRIASIWDEVLQLGKVGVYDDFFELGGNSLNVVQLKTRLTEELDKNIPVVALFQYATIRSFVEYLKTSEEKEVTASETFDRSEKFDKAKRTQKNIREKRKRRS